MNEFTELRQTRVFFEALFELAPDAIVVVNGEGRIVQINKQAEKIFGYSRDEVLGKPVEIFLPERGSSGRTGQPDAGLRQSTWKSCKNSTRSSETVRAARGPTTAGRG